MRIPGEIELQTVRLGRRDPEPVVDELAEGGPHVDDVAEPVRLYLLPRRDPLRVFRVQRRAEERAPVPAGHEGESRAGASQ